MSAEAALKAKNLLIALKAGGVESVRAEFARLFPAEVSVDQRGKIVTKLDKKAMLARVAEGLQREAAQDNNGGTS